MREWLKKIRAAENLTQQKLAERAGISPNFYSYIENGERRPSPEVAQEIAKVLDFEKYGRNWYDLLINSKDTA